MEKAEEAMNNHTTPSNASSKDANNSLEEEEDTDAKQDEHIENNNDLSVQDSTTQETKCNDESSKESEVKFNQVKELKKVRLLVSNIPFDIKWQDLKDLFKEKVGCENCFVEIYEGCDGKSVGMGVIEVKGKELANKTVEKLHKFELKGRVIVVREEKEKDRHSHPRYGVMGEGVHGDNRFVCSSAPLEALGIDLDYLSNQIFVANLDYSVTVKKIKEVFVMAGTILHVDLKMDKEGTSRGLATVCYENVVEAIQAIVMFNGQYLYDRVMNVRMDRLGDSSQQHVPPVLPSGLKGVGPGLGPAGQPLMNIGHIANLLVLNNVMSISSTAKLMNFVGKSPKNRTTATSLPPFNTSYNNTSYNNNTYYNNNSYNNNNSYPQFGNMSTTLYNHPYYKLISATYPLNNIYNVPTYPPAKHDLTTVVVKNLPYSVTWPVLKDKFKEAGDIQYVEVMMEGGRSKGVASIRFATAEAAKKAIGLFNNMKFEGRNIEVRSSF